MRTKSINFLYFCYFLNSVYLIYSQRIVYLLREIIVCISIWLVQQMLLITLQISANFIYLFFIFNFTVIGIKSICLFNV